MGGAGGYLLIYHSSINQEGGGRAQTNRNMPVVSWEEEET